jgi:FAD/FMN-containing dehydrogenase
MPLVNDVHSELNPTWVKEIVRPSTIDELRRTVAEAATRGESFSICGTRHAMGAQQFLADGVVVDMTGLDRVVSMDHERGLITMEAGMRWPALVSSYLDLQRAAAPDRLPRWGIRQKQTGADELTVGGAIAANGHGRGLLMGPMVEDVEAFTIVTAEGDLVECSRTTNASLFGLAIGGYGLFGPMATITLRLSPRQLLRRNVRIIDIEDAPAAATRRIGEGFLYGDFQFDIDPSSPDFLTKGVFSCYEPIDGDTDEAAKELSRDDWTKLLTLAHVDKRRAFALYAQHYIGTDGQTYWSDTHQLGVYIDGYHAAVDRELKSPHKCSEMITELYVPVDRGIDFLQAAAAKLTELEAEVIYGTIRLINKDKDTVLAWAQGRRVCVIFNLHVEHTPEGIERSGAAFRALIDLALERSGSFFLTYHRHATREQLLRGYPRLPEFLEAKRALDPRGLFTSEWHRWLVETLETVPQR